MRFQTNCGNLRRGNIEWIVPTGIMRDKGEEAMEPIQTQSLSCKERRSKAITELIEAVAEQQEALARILDA